VSAGTHCPAQSANRSSHCRCREESGYANGARTRASAPCAGNAPPIHTWYAVGSGALPGTLQTRHGLLRMLRHEKTVSGHRGFCHDRALRTRGVISQLRPRPRWQRRTWIGDIPCRPRLRTHPPPETESHATAWDLCVSRRHDPRM
jgi:hypothetical protein